MQGLIHLRVAAAAIGPEPDQLGHVLVYGDKFSGPVDGGVFFHRIAGRQGPGNAAQDVDRRKTSAFGDGPVQDHVPVENAAHGIGDGFVVVVAFDQHRKQPGDGALIGGSRAGPLQQLRQLGEHHRRIALAGRRFARRQADLPLGHGEAGDGIHQAQDVFFLVTEVFGHRHGDVGGLTAEQGAFVGGGDDDDAVGHAFGAEVILDKLPRLAGPFADHADDADLGGGMPSHHRQQRRFADARAGENTHPLPLAAGQKNIHRAHAQIDLAPHPLAFMSRRRRVVDGIGDGPRHQRPLAVDGFAKGVDDPAEPAFIGINHRLRGADFNAAPHADPFDRAERHQQRAIIGKTDHFAGHPAVVTGDDIAMIADRQAALDAADLDQQADNVGDLPENLVIGKAVDFLSNIGPEDGQPKPLQGVSKPNQYNPLPASPVWLVIA